MKQSWTVQVNKSTDKVFLTEETKLSQTLPNHIISILVISKWVKMIW